MWFKNATIFSLGALPCAAEQLAELLAPQAYAAGHTLAMETSGWAPVRDGGDLVYLGEGFALLRHRVARKLLPATVINEIAKAKAQEIERQQGYKPGRKQMREIKEAVTDELLPRAFSVLRETLVLVDLQAGRLVIDSATPSRCDEILQLLNKSIDRLPLAHIHLEMSPAAAMTDWLAADEAPAGFTIDQDTEMRASGESRATVRYLRQSVEADDARRHIEAGKQCTRLALTWADRVSFVLAENFAVKRIQPLDILKESQDALSKTDDERFAADMVLMVGELRRLVDDLIAAHGGQRAGA